MALYDAAGRSTHPSQVGAHNGELDEVDSVSRTGL